MLGDEDGPISRADAWIRGKGRGGLYVRPRLYMPYYEEVKVIDEIIKNYLVCVENNCLFFL
jgi:BTB/POZ domain-containing protein 7